MRQRGEFDGEDDVAIGKVETWILLERGRGEGGPGSYVRRLGI